MFKSPFPAHIEFSACDSVSMKPPTLLPEEEALLSASSAAIAQSTFRLGRHAAHSALQTMGVDRGIPILRNSDRSPRWPAGVVGSISHTVRAELVVAVAAVALVSKASSIGLDVEDLRRDLSESFIRRVCTARELSWIKEDPATRTQRALKIFSAKETLFKMLAPIFSGPKTFQGTELTYDNQQNFFIATFAPAISQRYPANSKHRISVQEEDDFILTAVVLDP